MYGARGVPSTYSGYETFLSLLLPELVERGDRVTMYCRTGEEFDNTPWDGVTRRVLPAVPGKNFSTLSHGLVAGIAARLARHDVVLVVNVANAAFCAISRYTGQPIVLNVDGQEWLRGKWGSTAKTIFFRSAQAASKCANALIADGAAMADIYRDDFGADSTVIPYCVTTDSWSADPTAVTAKGLVPGQYLLVGGRHNPENNIDRIVEAYEASDLALPLVALGTANYDSPVTAAISGAAERDDRIRLLGHISNRNEYFDLVHHAAVYLHGHSVGGTNPSLVEAMGVGARIAAFDTPFSRETLGPDGRFFALQGTDLADLLRDLLATDLEVDVKVRAETTARAADLFSVDSVVGAYRDLLHQAAATRRTTVVRTRWSRPSA